MGRFLASLNGYSDPTYLTSIVDLPTLPGGTSLVVRFLGAWDENTIGAEGANWEIDKVKIETLTDTDNDGIPDDFEDANGLNKNLNDAAPPADAPVSRGTAPWT